MERPDSRFDANLYSFGSASGVETIFEISMRVGASGKAKGASEGFAVSQSIIDRASETKTKDIMRWEGNGAWGPERLIEQDRAAMEKIKGGMEDLGIWAREGSEGIGSG
jgi:hypothetical protein